MMPGELCRADGAGGADILARTAFLALGGFHNIIAVILHGDRAFRALGLTGAALNTFGIDNVCHCSIPFEGDTGEILSEDSTIRQCLSTIGRLPFVM
jgi:hypothetical protein